MGHIALYREWRPRTFEEVVEQHFTVAALKQAVITGNIAHAYLFSGTRGTGKTTMAQIYSRAINCLAPEDGNPCNRCAVCKGILDGSLLDVIEMDAASNNNVDTIRRICDEVVFAPSVARFKVYIIDEVHMLSTGAFNALLKTLEEPPAHAVFILATTEQHRIPATILSRCQRYEFRRIPVQSIMDRLSRIADADHTAIDREALQLIARLADGALRDAISLLDQAKGSFTGRITKDNILSLVGMVNDDFMAEVARSILDGMPAEILGHIEKLVVEGRDVHRFTMDLVTYFRNLMVCLVTPDPDSLLNLPDRSVAELRDLASRVGVEDVIRLIRELSSLSSELKWSLNPRITLEVALLRLMSYAMAAPVSPTASIPLRTSVPAGKPAVRSAVPPATSDPVPDIVPAAAPLAAQDIVPAAASRDAQDIVPAVASRAPIGVVPATTPDTSTDLPSQCPPLQEAPAVSDAVTSGASLSATFPDIAVPVPSDVDTPSEEAFPSGPPLDGSDAGEACDPLPYPDEDIPPEEAPPSDRTVEAPDSVRSTIQEPVDRPEQGEAPVFDILQIWPRILDSIVSSGQMTVYLFLLPAKPAIVDGRCIRILFEEKDEMNYREIAGDRNIAIIRKAAQAVTGVDFSIQAELPQKTAVPSGADEGSGATSGRSDTPVNGIEALRKTAGELGIAFYMEE